MSPAELSVALLAPLNERGYQARIVSIGRVAELGREFADRRERGLLDPAIVQGSIARFAFAPPFASSNELPEARSAIVVAVPRPQHRIGFVRSGATSWVPIPPTYVGYEATRLRVTGEVAEVLRPAGYRVAPAALPLKLLATRSGLAAYGRNNVAYVPGFGSFFQLVGCFSDLPIEQGEWIEPRPLDRCAKCQACQRSCPTGAIASDRFALHAERCLTHLNESPGEFPDWVESSWHECAVGCLRCQRACPENRERLRWIEDAGTFSADETALLLAGTPRVVLPAATVDKIDRLGLAGYLEVLPRNLGALLA